MRLKLVSSKDTLLGHVDVPDHWREYFDRNFRATTAIVPRVPRFHDAAEICQPTYVQQVTLIKAEWSEYPDAVCLAEGSVEQLEALPGCSFTPSMAYLRSQAG